MTNFISPVKSARVTSPYGMRLHPIKKVNQMHGGIDLAGTVEKKPAIIASADGTVRVAKTLVSSYGKYVVITHNINGVLHETLYGHLDSYSVKEGQKVKQGDKIGVMGTTGSSTGVHLHFELHVGTYNYGGGKYPSSRDPLKYFSLGNTTVTKPVAATPVSNSYAGKKLLSKVKELNFYSKPSWDAKDRAGTVGKDIGFPTIVKKVKVGTAYQYEVKNSKGVTFYITASDVYVTLANK